MRSYLKPLLVAAVVVAAIVAVSAFQQTKNRNQTPVPLPTSTSQKIQVAILLDVSNSMDGLIDQAKAQLWTMVNTLGRVRCETNTSPKVEIALYEYGTPRNDSRKGYIRQINNFITDLDSLSENLFALTTNGGDEYCGHVIYSSANELEWDRGDSSYKVIFIAGNESFRQGEINFTQACTSAKTKGVIVNTIYCGDRQQGIREFWNLAGECGNGSFSNINQDQKIEDIATPFDDEIVQLNDKLNSTYIGYGQKGGMYAEKQSKMDKANAGVSRKAAIKRAEAKSNAKIYKNSNWDLVDRVADNEAELEKIDRKTLPDSLQNKTTAELKTIVKEKSKERTTIQTRIVELNRQRQQYINDDKKKGSTAAVATLETEVERIIKEQVQRFKMKVE
jgi:hypothetical protein